MITAHSTKQQLQKGFTLIELLVVLGILGILATALVATIDPFEQLKKANDANVKNSAVELVNASLRYFTTHNAMPWHVSGGVTGCGTAGAITAAEIDVAGLNCVNGLIDDGELKTQFTSATNITKAIFLTGTTLNAVTACFMPQSKSQERDAGTIYTSSGAVDGRTSTTACVGKGGTGTSVDCYWCAQL